MNIRRLERDELGLVAEVLAVVPVLELDDAVRAAHEDEDDGKEEEDEEDLHAARDLAPVLAEVRDEVVGEERREEGQGDDLEGEACEGDADADLGVGLVGAYRREGAAGRLKNEGDDVGGDEDPVEHARVEAGDGAVECVDAVSYFVSNQILVSDVPSRDSRLGEQNVDGGAVEDGSNSDAN